jgi:hypothetical protein
VTEQLDMSAAALDIDEDGDIYHLPSGTFGNLVALPARNEKYEVMHPDIFFEMVNRFNGWLALSAELTPQRAERDALQQAQTYRYIGKDGKSILARDLEDQRDAALARVEALEVALTSARSSILSMLCGRGCEFEGSDEDWVGDIDAALAKGETL